MDDYFFAALVCVVLVFGLVISYLIYIALEQNEGG